MAATGQVITAVDYNTIRTKVAEVIGIGAGSYGYGQELISDSLSLATEPRVTKDEWDALRYDIINSLVHQTGNIPSVTEVQRGAPIVYASGEPIYQYNVLADQLRTNRFELGTGQYIIQSGASDSSSSSWSNEAYTTLTVSFTTAEQARYFFNSGGKIRFTSSFVRSTTNSQNIAWETLLNRIGTVVFTGNPDHTSNFYNLTTTYAEIYNSTGVSAYTSIYSTNQFSIQARRNSDSTEIEFYIRWRDLYTDSNPSSPPPDLVNGTLTITVDEVRASGVLLPEGTGNFAITRPNYTIATIITS